MPVQLSDGTPVGVSVKGVVFDDDRRVLLCKNDRAEWELPGGRIEPGETAPQCLVREILEEAGLDVQVGRYLDERAFEVVPGKSVTIVAYECRLVSSTAPTRSEEHEDVRFWPLTALPDLVLPDVYRHAIGLCAPVS